MKKLSILATTFFPLLILYFNGTCQPAPNWVARYNGPGNKMDQARKIAEDKLEDLNTDDVEMGARVVAGTARSMGITVE